MKNDTITGKKKRSLIVILIVLLVAVLLAVGLIYMKPLLEYENKVASIDVRNVDLQTIENGTYYGDCDVGYIRAQVRVVIRDHVITEIELLEHYNDRGAAADVLPNQMIEQQRIDVDAVSGATSSSRVIQEAVYNALTGERTIS